VVFRSTVVFRLAAGFDGRSPRTRERFDVLPRVPGGAYLWNVDRDQQPLPAPYTDLRFGDAQHRGGFARAVKQGLNYWLRWFVTSSQVLGHATILGPCNRCSLAVTSAKSSPLVPVARAVLGQNRAIATTRPQ
jgi:hypothetical protein